MWEFWDGDENITLFLCGLWSQLIMPQKARIDAPGALHHIIYRGIERRHIFYDDEDRDSFVDRLADPMLGTSTGCYGWALVDNHAHLLLRTGDVPIATVMRRLLTGYAVTYNRRHRRGAIIAPFLSPFFAFPFIPWPGRRSREPS